MPFIVHIQLVMSRGGVTMGIAKLAIFCRAAASWTGYSFGRTGLLFPFLHCHSDRPSSGWLAGKKLLRAAGWAQSRAGTGSPAFGDWYRSAPYGDDPDDQAWIRMGIEYAKHTGF